MHGTGGQFIGNLVMLMGKFLSARLGRERRTSRPRRWVAAVMLLLGLAACNPVETWRDLTGASRNDPDPDTTPNSQNLAAGEASDYPNLATVPPPPVRAMTSADQEKLTQGLIADRANARYSDEQLRAGFAAASAAPPTTPTALPTDPGIAATESIATALPPSPPPAPPPSSAPVPSGQPAKPSTLPAAAAAVSPTRDVAALAQPAPSMPESAQPSAKADRKRTVAPGQGLRKQGEPPEPGPMESSLEVPQTRATPQPEQIEPPPPPPQMAPTAKVASTAASLPSGLAVGGALAPPRLPEAAPPPPELPPPAPTRSAAADPGKGSQKPAAPVGKPVAEIKFSTDSTSLTEGERQRLEKIVPIYRQNPGKIRVVGYAEAGSGAVEQLNGYRAALDRAQAVAAALTKAGVPADKIEVEAAPSAASSGGSRAEVLLEHQE
ncbi:MAG: OmpA family protein [Stellaceae bacterium]